MSLTSRKPLPMVLESAGIRYNGDSDYIELLNPTTGEWVQWEKSNVMSKMSTITVTTNNLNGEVITCSINGQTATETFVGGVATFNLFVEGVATITCGNLTQSITVTAGGTYNILMDRPQAVVNFTTSNLDGEIITLVVNSVSYSGVFAGGVATIIVYDFGTATIKCDEVSTTLDIAEGGSYSVDLTEFAEIPLILGGANQTTFGLASGWNYQSDYARLYYNCTEQGLSKGLFKGNAFQITEEMRGKTIEVMSNEGVNTVKLYVGSTLVASATPVYNGTRYITSVSIPADCPLGYASINIGLNKMAVYIYIVTIK